MWNNIGQITIELLIGFFVLLASTKLLGKTQISQLTPFDFISAIVLGELVGNAIYDSDVKILSILYAVILWTILIYCILLITQKFRKTRKILEGRPSIVIRNGHIDKQQLKVNKLDINELQQMLRQEKDIFSLREVEFAVFEPNGKISALKKPKYASPTIEDLHLNQQKVYLPISLISDGQVDKDNLKKTGFDENWLLNQIKANGITEFSNVLYADWKEDEGFFCMKMKQ
ncbi:DUF421 domain-containing protein [Bacillus sp. V3B]|uniref:YetF domain-containing protein n=1 Tax=Bacillus sp. V3B TaxID=2804915 RepID=UPI00210A75E9|nr:DUF421 domain-containing protein [Bacillus sp. V3B]MCQ6274981.1 DUF421 domain-containing protein [Bacillus sp. V3B]